MPSARERERYSQCRASQREIPLLTLYISLLPLLGKLRCGFFRLRSPLFRFAPSAAPLA